MFKDRRHARNFLQAFINVNVANDITPEQFMRMFYDDENHPFIEMTLSLIDTHIQIIDLADDNDDDMIQLENSIDQISSLLHIDDDDFTRAFEEYCKLFK